MPLQDKFPIAIFVRLETLSADWLLLAAFQVSSSTGPASCPNSLCLDLDFFHRIAIIVRGGFLSFLSGPKYWAFFGLSYYFCHPRSGLNYTGSIVCVLAAIGVNSDLWLL